MFLVCSTIVAFRSLYETFSPLFRGSGWTERHLLLGVRPSHRSDTATDLTGHGTGRWMHVSKGRWLPAFKQPAVPWSRWSRSEEAIQTPGAAVAIHPVRMGKHLVDATNSSDHKRVLLVEERAVGLTTARNVVSN